MLRFEVFPVLLSIERGCFLFFLIRIILVIIKGESDYEFLEEGFQSKELFE